MKAWASLLSLFGGIGFFTLVFGVAAFSKESPKGEPIRLLCAEELITQAQQQGGSCRVFPTVSETSDPYVLLSLAVRCTGPREAGGASDPRSAPPITWHAVCHAVLDRRTQSVVNEVRMPSYFHVLDLFEAGGGLWILGSQGDQWQLWDARNGERAATWKIPDVLKVGSPGIRLRVQVIESGGWPDEALRVAVLRPEGPSILRIVELWPPGRPGEAVRVVADKVPLATWKQAWMETSKVREHFEKIFRQSQVLELARKLLIPLDREVDRFIERRPTAELRSSILYFLHQRNKLYFYTMKPFSLTEVDVLTGTYRFISLRGDAGSHFQDLAWDTQWYVADIAPGPRDTLWLLLEGTLFIERSRLSLIHPSAKCFHVETLGLTGEEYCALGGRLIFYVESDQATEGWWVSDTLSEATPRPRRGALIEVRSTSAKLIVPKEDTAFSIMDLQLHRSWVP